MRGLGWAVEVREGFLKGVIVSSTSGCLGLCRPWDPCIKPAIVGEVCPGLCAEIGRQIHLAFSIVVLLILKEQAPLPFS